jgi:hypothetical protein
MSAREKAYGIGISWKALAPARWTRVLCRRRVHGIGRPGYARAAPNSDCSSRGNRMGGCFHGLAATIKAGFRPRGQSTGFGPRLSRSIPPSRRAPWRRLPACAAALGAGRHLLWISRKWPRWCGGPDPRRCLGGKSRQKRRRHRHNPLIQSAKIRHGVVIEVQATSDGNCERQNVTDQS